MSNLALDLLLAKRDTLLSELREIQNKYDSEIQELNKAIVKLSGKSVPEIEIDRYDDESPTYIKGTEDGI